jgi:hypothetical protein
MTGNAAIAFLSKREKMSTQAASATNNTFLGTAAIYAFLLTSDLSSM